MENVTDRRRNPFGVRYPCEDGPPVPSYGDANADVHLIGDHPGVHGGRESGVPLDHPDAAPLLAVLRAVGLVEDAAPTREEGEEADAAPYVPRNLFCSYLHACSLPGDREPTDAGYADLEPSFDAELRAVAAHVLVPVGDRALAHVLEEYTSRARRVEADAAALHAGEIPGRGFLVVPVREPAEWTDEDDARLAARLRAVLDSDYRRTADLGRFFPGDDAYLVR